MVIKVTQNGLVDIGPTEDELRERRKLKEWAFYFEQVRRSHYRIAEKVRAGDLPHKWQVLRTLAISSPHFTLNPSYNYSNIAISEKLSQHLVFCLSQEIRTLSDGGMETLPFTDTIGDELFVQAALNWSPAERFRLSELHCADDTELQGLLSQLANSDPLFFDALLLATDFIETDKLPLTSVIQGVTQGLKTKQISRPRQPRGKRASSTIVYRRLGARLFFHEMKKLGFVVGAGRESNRSDTVAHAVVEALRHNNWTPIPSPATILEDWNEWKYKNT